ncbi:preprotein translocase subunit TatA [Streptomyces canus]|uniref:Sec-independent protein translocase protein TatA n=1 Tax=Streptomyces canus TaxID=58343 RepID=A0A101RXS6_9ACTN|nr:MULTISPECIES: Sec-independent protein translocase subunit TatA [Streptomyces]KUN63678.1 preprotein translocase subunit TatA [Streptomyces canus]MDI5908836.1 Sec-independent protein translocase subunit TatA [Streptomyces sp. 12257]
MLRNGLEPWHLLVVAIMIILLFGSKKLPEAARGLGKSMRILKSEAKAMKEDGIAHSAAPAESAPHVVQSTPGETTAAQPTAESNPAH